MTRIGMIANKKYGVMIILTTIAERHKKKNRNSTGMAIGNFY